MLQIPIVAQTIRLAEVTIVQAIHLAIQAAVTLLVIRVEDFRQVTEEEKATIVAEIAKIEAGVDIMHAAYKAIIAEYKAIVKDKDAEIAKLEHEIESLTSQIHAERYHYR